MGAFFCKRHRLNCLNRLLSFPNLRVFLQNGSSASSAFFLRRTRFSAEQIICIVCSASPIYARLCRRDRLHRLLSFPNVRGSLHVNTTSKRHWDTTRTQAEIHSETSVIAAFFCRCVSRYVLLVASCSLIDALPASTLSHFGIPLRGRVHQRLSTICQVQRLHCRCTRLLASVLATPRPLRRP